MQCNNLASLCVLRQDVKREGSGCVQGGPIQLLKPKFSNYALSVHYYNQNDSQVEGAFRKFAAQADAWNVPLFVGEFAFAAVLDKFINVFMVRGGLHPSSECGKG